MTSIRAPLDRFVYLPLVATLVAGALACKELPPRRGDAGQGGDDGDGGGGGEVQAGGGGRGGTGGVRDAAAGPVDAPVLTSCEANANKTPGAACGCDQECASGFCAAGVCCQTKCEGPCLSCAVVGQEGTCTPVPAGGPPRSGGSCQTEDPSTCGFDGLCDGKGACRKYPDNTVCTKGTCQSGSVTGTKVCIGGKCEAGPAVVCAPYGCNSETNECFDKCTEGGQCAAGRQCANGSCGLKPTGAKCAKGEECESTFCADGVCCNTKCDGACVSCNQLQAPGECKNVAENQADPHGVCKDTGRASCGTTGTCDGKGACAKYADNSVCKDASCSGDVWTPASTCSGGSCVPTQPRTCAPFQCAGSACLDKCTKNEDCVAPSTCQNGSCGKKPDGQSCTGADQCVSGFCVDGVCCDGACAGACRSCNLAGSPGKCTNVGGGTLDPRGMCTDKGASTCKENGRCNGSGGCQLYANTTQCSSPSCDGASNKATAAGYCDGAGTCKPGQQTECNPFRCNGTVCGQSCATDDQCVSPASCTGNTCGKKAEGLSCSSGAQCQSGICAQGVCCGTACSGSCQSCALNGSRGQCKPVPAGNPDPQGQCQNQGGCGTTGVCNGAGSCAYADTSVVCASETCTTSGGVPSYTPTRKCNGSGQCAAAASSACPSNLLCANLVSCYASCSNDGQCRAGHWCSGGTCTALKGNGVACSAANQCSSGQCVDGVCCNSACNAACQTCSTGTCAAVTNAEDPGTCSGAQQCNGSGSCKNKNGGSCSSSADCLSSNCSNALCCGVGSLNCGGTCVAGNCCSDAQCGAGTAGVCDVAAKTCWRERVKVRLNPQYSGYYNTDGGNCSTNGSKVFVTLGMFSDFGRLSFQNTLPPNISVTSAKLFLYQQFTQRNQENINPYLYGVVKVSSCSALQLCTDYCFGSSSTDPLLSNQDGPGWFSAEVGAFVRANGFAFTVYWSAASRPTWLETVFAASGSFAPYLEVEYLTK